MSNITWDIKDPNKQKAYEETQQKKQTILEEWEKKTKCLGEFAIYYEDGYVKDGEIQEKLFREYAVEVATKITTTATKVRQYYNMINDMYQSGKKPSKEKLYLLLAKANYDSQRDKLGKFFIDFLNVNVNIVFNKDLGGTEDSTKKFELFKKHFEAVLCYYKENSEKSGFNKSYNRQ